MPQIQSVSVVQKSTNIPLVMPNGGLQIIVLIRQKITIISVTPALAPFAKPTELPKKYLSRE